MYAKERQSLGAFSFPNQLTKGLTRGKMVNALCPVLIFLIHLFLSTPIFFFCSASFQKQFIYSVLAQNHLIFLFHGRLNIYCLA